MNGDVFLPLCVGAHAFVSCEQVCFSWSRFSFIHAERTLAEAEKGECRTRCVCSVLSEFFLVSLAASLLWDSSAGVVSVGVRWLRASLSPFPITCSGALSVVSGW